MILTFNPTWVSTIQKKLDSLQCTDYTAIPPGVHLMPRKCAQFTDEIHNSVVLDFQLISAWTIPHCNAPLAFLKRYWFPNTATDGNIWITGPTTNPYWLIHPSICESLFGSSNYSRIPKANCSPLCCSSHFLEKPLYSYDRSSFWLIWHPCSCKQPDPVLWK